MLGPSLQVQDLAQPEMDVSFLSSTPGAFSTGTSGSADTAGLCHWVSCVQNQHASFLPAGFVVQAGMGLWLLVTSVQHCTWILAIRAGLGCSCRPAHHKPSRRKPGMPGLSVKAATRGCMSQLAGSTVPCEQGASTGRR